MSKKEKLLKKAIKSPGNLMFKEFKTLIGQYGFEHRNTKGDHEIYKNLAIGKMLNIQPDKNDKSKAKKYQIKEFINILKNNGLLED